MTEATKEHILGDVSNLQMGERLIYDGTNWINTTPDTSLTSLTDTSLSSLQNGQSLIYIGSNWTNSDVITVTTNSIGTEYVHINSSQIAEITNSFGGVIQSRKASLITDGGIIIKAASTTNPLQYSLLCEGNGRFLGSISTYENLNVGNFIVNATSNLFTYSEGIEERDIYRGTPNILGDININIEAETLKVGNTLADPYFSVNDVGNVNIKSGLLSLNGIGGNNNQALVVSGSNGQLGWKNTLTDINLTDPLQNGQSLIYNGTNWANTIPDHTLTSLTDTSLTPLKNGQSLIYNGTNWANDAYETTLADLTDTDLTNPLQNGQSLIYNGTNWANTTPTLTSLTDTNLTDPLQNGQSLIYNGTNWANTIPDHTLTSLTDTSLSTLQTGQSLIYNGTNWVNKEARPFAQVDISQNSGTIVNNEYTLSPTNSTGYGITPGGAASGKLFTTITPGWYSLGFSIELQTTDSAGALTYTLRIKKNGAIIHTVRHQDNSTFGETDFIRPFGGSILVNMNPNHVISFAVQSDGATYTITGNASLVKVD